MAVNNLDNKVLSKSEEYPHKPFSFGDFLWSPKWRPFRYQNIHIIIQLLEKSSLFKFTGSATKKHSRGGKPRADNAEVIFSSRAFSELQFSFLYCGFSQHYLHHNLVSNAAVTFLTESCKIMPTKPMQKKVGSRFGWIHFSRLRWGWPFIMSA